MSEPSDKEQIYAITRFLDGLSDGQSATAKATIAELNTKLSSIFSTDLTNVNDFLALDYGSDVSSILEAGAKSLNVSTFCVFISYCCDFKYIHPLSHFYFVFWFDQAGLYDTDLAEAKTNPHFAPYTQVIVGRQYFSGTIDGTYENLRRKARMLAKFRYITYSIYMLINTFS